MITILFAVIGIFSVSLLTKLPDIRIFYLIISTVIGLVSYLLLTHKRHAADNLDSFTYYRCSRYMAVLAISFLLGFSYSYLVARSLLDKQLAIDLDNKTFVIEGVVNGLVKRSLSSISFSFLVKGLQVENADKSLSKINTRAYKTVRLSYYLNKKRKNNAITQVRTGDHWQFRVKLKRPRGFVNPSSFDYQAYLLAQGLSATGYIKNSQDNKKIANDCRRFFSATVSINCLRAGLNDCLDKNFSHSMTLGILKGLLTGDKQSITTKQWDTLQNTGTVHLLAISGLHIGLAASIGFLLGKFFQRLSQWIVCTGVLRAFRTPGIDRYIPSVFSILFALVYSLLAGFSLPTQRALIMLGAFHCGLLLYHRSRPWFLWCIALFLTALLDPLAIYNQGFWLSFAAVAILILVFNGYISYKNRGDEKSKKIILFNKSYHFLLGFSKGQWAISIGLLLPSLLLLNGVSGLGFIANFIAIPLVSLITVPLILIGLLLLPIASSLTLVIFSLADNTILLLFIVLESIEQLGIRFWSLSLGDKSLLSLFIALVGVWYFLLPKGIPGRWLGCVCVLPLFLPSLLPEFFIQKELPTLEVTMFDVGQGTAIVLETPNHTLIYDAGRRYSHSFDVGEHILSPYLLQKRKSNIDILMISHNDTDHAGGVNGLLKTLNIKNIYAGESSNSEHVNAKQCRAGQQWQWDGVSFTVVWPTNAVVNKEQNAVLPKSNNLSCVLLITYQSHSILLAGDIETSVEKQLISHRLVPKDVSLLLAPHHGSRTSSHLNWVNYVQAKHVVFSAGYKNPYRHPHVNVVRDYQAAGASTYNTAIDGAIKFTINGPEAVIDTSREVQKRYWYD